MQEPIGKYNVTLIFRTRALKSRKYNAQKISNIQFYLDIRRRILSLLQYQYLVDRFNNEESFQLADRDLFAPLLQTLRRYHSVINLEALNYIRTSQTDDIKL